MGIHDGHRQRMKRRFVEFGGEVFDDHQMLELLLFYSKPQGDVNPLAHKLLGHFGSIDNVLDASVHELTQIKGVGEHTAIHLKLVKEMIYRYQLCRAKQDDIVNSCAQAGEYLHPYFFGARCEMVFLLGMDIKGKVLFCGKVSEGQANSAGLDIRKVVSMALEHHCSTAVLAHNHPSGLAIPSKADAIATRRVLEALRPLHINLLDHLVFSDGDFISLRESSPSVWAEY